jgi:hypothetical protein
MFLTPLVFAVEVLLIEVIAADLDQNTDLAQALPWALPPATVAFAFCRRIAFKYPTVPKVRACEPGKSRENLPDSSDRPRASASGMTP